MDYGFYYGYGVFLSEAELFGIFSWQRWAPRPQAQLTWKGVSWHPNWPRVTGLYRINNSSLGVEPRSLCRWGSPRPETKFGWPELTTSRRAMTQIIMARSVNTQPPNPIIIADIWQWSHTHSYIRLASKNTVALLWIGVKLAQVALDC